MKNPTDRKRTSGEREERKKDQNRDERPRQFSQENMKGPLPNEGLKFTSDEDIIKRRTA